MLSDKQKMIALAIANGTGAQIGTRVVEGGLRKRLIIWFSDLAKSSGPLIEMKPHGLKSHAVNLSFGSFAARTLKQISNAGEEEVQLARSLIKYISTIAEVDIPQQDVSNWAITDGRFCIKIIYRHHEVLPHEDSAMLETCDKVVVPLMAAMAELIGYNVVEETQLPSVAEVEGGLSLALVYKRERNPRNRFLCISLHGNKCGCCGADPELIYSDAGGIIEVHHLEPLSMIERPRPYNPETDLVPLCPNCHRAVHTRRPWPLSLEELAEKMQGDRS